MGIVAKEIVDSEMLLYNIASLMLHRTVLESDVFLVAIGLSEGYFASLYYYALGS